MGRDLIEAEKEQEESRYSGDLSWRLARLHPRVLAMTTMQRRGGSRSKIAPSFVQVRELCYTAITIYSILIVRIGGGTGGDSHTVAVSLDTASATACRYQC